MSEPDSDDFNIHAFVFIVVLLFFIFIYFLIKKFNCFLPADVKIRNLHKSLKQKNKTEVN